MIRPLNALIVPATALTLFAGSVAVVKHVNKRPTPPPTVIKEVHTLEAVQQARVSLADFPEHFTGSFSWDGESTAYAQTVAMDVEALNHVDDLLVATGRGTYTTTSRKVDFTFRIEVDPITGEFEMWESEPSVSAGFVTQGRHEARITNSMDVIRARWIGDDGQMGRLTLEASDRSFRQQARKGCRSASGQIR